MLRWLCGKSRHDIRNDNIKESDGVTTIVEKMVETDLYDLSM